MVALAPLLLLLTQDGVLLPALTDKRRYAPVVTALLAYLSAAALYDAGILLAVGEALSGALVLAAVACSLPSAALLVIFLWQRRRQSEWWLLFTAPPNLLPALFSASRAAQLLAAACMLGAALQSIAMRRTRRAGAKLI